VTVANYRISATKAAKGSLVVTIGQLLSYGCSMVRNMILARLLSRADFGACAGLGIMLGLFELTGKMGIARFVVQDPEGDQAGFAATMHTILLGVGLASGMLLLCGAPFLVKAFNFQGPIWLVMGLGLVSLFNGLQHLDIRRYERTLRFAPSVSIEVFAQVIITAAALPLATVLADYRVFLILIVAKTIIECALSHIFAENHYRLGWNRDIARRAFIFGWPLLLTGYLMYGIMQGDQFIVASFYNLAELAPYTAAASLVMIPSFVIGNLFNAVALPVLSQAQENNELFKNRYRTMMNLLLLVSVPITSAVVLGAEALMTLVYGAKYAGSGLLLALLAVSNGFRNLRVAPALAALARADSKNSFVSNLGRATALLPMLFAGLTRQPLWMIAGCGILGEILACWISFRRLEKRDGIPFRENMYAITIISAVVVGSALVFFLVVGAWPIPAGLMGAAAGSILVAALVIVTNKSLRVHAFSLPGVWSREGGSVALKRILSS
jgi:O-antigen/teichoic acid export membrane protein